MELRVRVRRKDRRILVLDGFPLLDSFTCLATVRQHDERGWSGNGVISVYSTYLATGSSWHWTMVQQIRGS